MEVALSDGQPGQIMQRNRYFVLQRSRKASANVGEGGGSERRAGLKPTQLVEDMTWYRPERGAHSAALDGSQPVIGAHCESRALLQAFGASATRTNCRHAQRRPSRQAPNAKRAYRPSAFLREDTRRRETGIFSSTPSSVRSKVPPDCGSTSLTSARLTR